MNKHNLLNKRLYCIVEPRTVTLLNKLDVTQLRNAGPSVSGEREYVTAAYGERQSDLTLTSISVGFRHRTEYFSFVTHFAVFFCIFCII